MKFEDPVYGEQEVEKDVIKQLIKSQPVQRLKNIQQAGPQTYFMDKNEVTRFEHSLGVFFLLRRFDASIEEQIAGLLHDVPHTAFSHLVDFVFENEDHEYHEEFMEEIIYDSEIPDILEEHGLNVEEILDESNFGLLERDLPALCADRIDYFLRDTTVVREKDITHFLNHIRVENGLFVLDDKQVVEEYALEYIKTDQELWAHPKEVAIFELFAEVVREAFETDELEEKDLFKTDKELYQTIQEMDNKFVQQRLEMLKQGFEVELTEDEEGADIISKTKGRAVDPDVITSQERLKVSEYSEKLREEKEKHLNQVENGYRIKIKN